MGRGAVAVPGEDEVAQGSRATRPGLATRRNLALVSLAVALLVLARCGGDIGGLFRTGTAYGNQPFRNGSFLITTTSLAYDIQSIDAGAAAKSHGVTSYKPKNGQFIVFNATATNVSFASASMPSASTTLTDAAGKTYKAAGPFVGAVGQGFDQKQPPGMTHAGWFVFDVPESLTMPKTLSVQSDPRQGTTNPPTSVKFG
ncbi:MAG: hypothetical protein ABI899_12540 [Actinomycetota bacterium]